jgi:hypothetical protein
MATTNENKDAITHIEQTSQPQKVDAAAKFLETTQTIDASFTYEEERAVLRRIDLRVLPLLLGAYFFQQLDKSSLSYVSVFGIQKDAGLVGKQYSWLGSILYLAQLIMQPLAAFLLVKLPTGKVIAGAVLLWGASLAIMSACTSFPSLLGLRFVLGSFEAMIAPACVATTTMWWRRSEQTLRTAYWNAMNGVTFIVGSLFTYGLGHIETDDMYKYQIIFLFWPLDRALRIRRPCVHAGLANVSEVLDRSRARDRDAATACKSNGRSIWDLEMGPSLGDISRSQNMVLVYHHYCHLVSFFRPTT